MLDPTIVTTHPGLFDSDQWYIMAKAPSGWRIALMGEVDVNDPNDWSQGRENAIWHGADPNTCQLANGADPQWQEAIWGSIEPLLSSLAPVSDEEHIRNNEVVFGLTHAQAKFAHELLSTPRNAFPPSLLAYLTDKHAGCTDEFLGYIVEWMRLEEGANI